MVYNNEAQERERLELAGFVDVNTGAVGKPVPSGCVTVPGRVYLTQDETAIRWQYIDQVAGSGSSDEKVIRWVLSGGGAPRYREVGRAMLNEFIELWRKTPKAILRFAQRWGCLWPVQWSPVPADGAGRMAGGDWRQREEGEELIEDWRFLSARAHAVLQLAATVATTSGKRPVPEDVWKCLAVARERMHSEIASGAIMRLGFPCYVRPDAERAHLLGKSLRDLEKRILSDELNSWLQRSGAGLQVVPAGGLWQIEIDYHGSLLAAVAMQLVLAPFAGGLFVCDGCGWPYIRVKGGKRVRLPNAGQKNFCENCGVATARRKADERRRERVGRAREMARRGASVTAIAAKLDTSVASVRRWIKGGASA
jgi:transposase-like protein